MTEDTAVPNDSGSNPVTRGGIAAAIAGGLLFGASVGLVAGLFLRPRDRWSALSREWLQDLQEATQRVTHEIRGQLSEVVNRRSEHGGVSLDSLDG